MTEAGVSGGGGGGAVDHIVGRAAGQGLVFVVVDMVMVGRPAVIG